jgi:hypothetical protein
MRQLHNEPTRNISVKSSSLLCKHGLVNSVLGPGDERSDLPHVLESSLFRFTQRRANSHGDDDIVSILVQKRSEIGR